MSAEPSPWPETRMRIFYTYPEFFLHEKVMMRGGLTSRASGLNLFFSLWLFTWIRALLENSFRPALIPLVGADKSESRFVLGHFSQVDANRFRFSWPWVFPRGESWIPLLCLLFGGVKSAPGSTFAWKNVILVREKGDWSFSSGRRWWYRRNAPGMLRLVEVKIRSPHISTAHSDKRRKSRLDFVCAQAKIYLTAQ